MVTLFHELTKRMKTGVLSHTEQSPTNMEKATNGVKTLSIDGSKKSSPATDPPSKNSSNNNHSKPKPRFRRENKNKKENKAVKNQISFVREKDQSEMKKRQVLRTENNNKQTQTEDKSYEESSGNGNLPTVMNDPRGKDPSKRLTKNASSRGTGRNTESFDPVSTFERPSMRILVGSNSVTKYNRKLKHDDVVMVPELFGPEDDWNLYHKLIEEIADLQQEGEEESKWISWHEGAHLISKKPPKKSKTFNMIIDRLCEYFNISKKSAGTRFNWYTDSVDWKPFHHDSAAYNEIRAKQQNITVGVSFGATRELAFLHTKKQEDGSQMKIYFPQTNNGVFTFGRDVNISWKHGVNALKPGEQDGKGRQVFMEHKYNYSIP